MAILALSTAWAVPLASAAEVAAQTEPKPLCTVADERLAELSGLAVGRRHWYAVNDGGKQVEVFVLDENCVVQDVITNPTNPYDVEDLARSADGTLWVGDTGDNSGRRETVALHKLRPDGVSTLYRLTYPDGRHNAEALLLAPDGTPYIITKSLAAAGVYRPVGDLASPGPTPLEKVASVRLDMTDTLGGPVGSVGSTFVTGAAFNQDGTVLAIRTYTDAYLYPAPDGDVAAALRQEPVRIPLPGEPQGEAIAFVPDGTLLSASEGVGEPIRAISGAAGLVDTESNADSAASGEAAGDARAEGLPTIPAVAVAVVLAGAVVFGLSRMRRRR